MHRLLASPLLASPLLASLLVASPLLAGCSGSASTPDAGPPSLEIGTGRDAFVSLQDGDEIRIVLGPQGGYHIYGSILAKNIDPGDSEDLSNSSNPSTLFEVYADGERVDAMASSYKQGLRKVPAGAQMLGRLVILDIGSDTELRGTSLRFVVRLVDANGVMLRDERMLVPVPDPANP